MCWVFNSQPAKNKEFRDRYFPPQESEWLRSARESLELQSTSVPSPSAPSKAAPAPAAHRAEVPGASAGGAAKHRRRRHRGRSAGAVATSTTPEPPAAPGAWLAEMKGIAMQPLACEGATESHRHFWFHPSTKNFPLGKTEMAGAPVGAPGHRGPECTEGRKGSNGIGLRPREMGSLKSDYSQQENDIQKYLQLRKIQGSNSTPTIFITELNRRGLNPSMVSEQVCGSFVGGTTTALKHTLIPGSAPSSLVREDKRQIGLYEDSFACWPNGSYRPPAHGNNQSEITVFGNEMILCKNMVRTKDPNFILRDPRTRNPAPGWI